MALKKKPVNGTKDILPREMEIRSYVQSVIESTYSEFGFTRIQTPALEDIGNLLSKQGGDNEKLIFKVLKRGEKLKLDEAKEENDLVDMGLRYDLTVPLVRFYSNNANELVSPFKALQMDNVWRADRPQRGRFRQFMQCDIDILGEPSNLAEIELILATTTTLGKLGFKGFEIRINDRRMLKAMATYAGFSEESFDSVFITLDKMDKIGIEGVKAELLENGFAEAMVDKYLDLYSKIQDNDTALKTVKEILGEDLAGESYVNLDEIITTVDEAKTADFKMVFDPTLVRGMSYYTGTIFEIAIPEFGGSCGGGGRYDEMVGKFTGNNVPACGFSIGFERICLLLLEQGFSVPTSGRKVAYLIEKGYAREGISKIMQEAAQARKEGQTVLVVRMNKNKKFQKDQLTQAGYVEFKEYFKEQN